MLTNLSGKNRTRRKEVSPKVKEALQTYSVLARQALLRAYPSIPNFGVEICILDAEDSLELFWSVFDLGGDAPGGWYQAHNVKLVFERASDGKTVEQDLIGHVAGFHAWYRMRGGMISVLPRSLYLNLGAGEWSVYVTGELQDAQALCLFADAFGDLFHYHYIQQRHDRVRDEVRSARIAGHEDPAPIVPFRIPAGVLALGSDRTGLIRDRQLDRLHQTPVHFSDVEDVPLPGVTPPPATSLDPVNHFRDKLYYLHEQSVRYNYCPYDTVNHWDHDPVFDRAHYFVNERTAYFHIEALAPLYRATGDLEVYRTARKWYETIRRNVWPVPGGGAAIVCDRTVFGSALQLGGTCDALCTFTEIDGDPRWLEPFCEGLLAWPMHPTIPRPLMDQDAWGNEEMNTTGTYNMCTHFALACWRMGHLAGNEALKDKAETILDGYTFRGEEAGIWPYRPGDYPSHHYDMYLKWQLSRLLMTGAERWTRDEGFLALMRRGTEASLSNYTHEENGELLFPDWTHNADVTHPANAVRHGAQQVEVLMTMAIYVDGEYLSPLERALRGVYRLLALPEVDRCWHGAWFHVHGNLLSLALNGFHVEGDSPEELRVVRRAD